MKIKTGDTVQVMTGEQKGKVGKVMAVFPKENRLIVKDVNVQTVAKKPTSMQDPGGLIKREGKISASNVLLYDEKEKRGVRVRMEDQNGKKVRISVKSGASFDK